MSDEELRSQFIDQLAEVYDNNEESRALLEDVRFPPRQRPNFSAYEAPGRFWEVVVRLIEQGVLDSAQGIGDLARAAARPRPGNPVFRAAVDGFAGPAEPEPEPPEPHPEEAQSRNYNTIVFYGTKLHEDFLRLVRELIDPDAQLAFTTRAGVCAVSISPEAERDYPRLEALVRARAERLEPDIEIDVQQTTFPPYVLNSLIGRGPDGQRFELTSVPANTLAGEVGAAVMSNYASQAVRDGRNRLRRIVIDHLRRNGSEQRLRQDDSLGNQGVEDGDMLNVASESTAGVGHGLRSQAIARVRGEVSRFADGRPGFRIERMNDPQFPTEYDVVFEAPGFAPPDDVSVHPIVPVDRDVHRVTIALHDEFPLKAPVVRFRTPIFHPNVLRDPPAAQADLEGFVCLGVLQEQYTPGLNFGSLCALLVDLAAYRSYEIRAVGEDSEGLGYLDQHAVDWVKSADGARRIAERGGRVRILGDEAYASRHMFLAIRRVDGADGN